MESFVSLKESKKYFDRNISPCSVAANKLVNWEKWTNTLLVTSHIDDDNQDLENHVATRQSNNEIEASPNSDEKFLQWLASNNLILVARDFALNKPVNKGISESESVFLENELFYVIEPNDTHANLKLSLSKSWAFFGFLVKSLPEDLSTDEVVGIVMGVHKLDSYLVVK